MDFGLELGPFSGPEPWSSDILLNTYLLIEFNLQHLIQLQHLPTLLPFTNLEMFSWKPEGRVQGA